MKSDAEVHYDGVKALMQLLGVVDAERFIALINRERFDYTKWRARGLAGFARGLRVLREGRATGTLRVWV